MPKSKIIIALGCLIALLPILGFPNSWEAFFQVATGLSIVGVSFWATIDKKLTMKAKAERRQALRRVQDVAVPAVPRDTGQTVEHKQTPTDEMAV